MFKTYGAWRRRGLLCSEYPLDSKEKTGNQLKSPSRCPSVDQNIDKKRKRKKDAGVLVKNRERFPPVPTENFREEKFPLEKLSAQRKENKTEDMSGVKHDPGLFGKLTPIPKAGADVYRSRRFQRK